MTRILNKLSDHFTWQEMTVSATAARLGMKNVPPAVVQDTLILTADYMERVRTLLGNRPIIVLSGYRSPAVNRAVGGSASSAHMSGHAVDFICPGFGSARQVALHLAKVLPPDSYDQIIEEFDQWVHIGWGPRKRGQQLTARKVKGKTVYTPGIA